MTPTAPLPNRVVYGKTLVELGERDPRIIVFEADIAKSTNTYRFGERFPERFFNCGAAELNMICMAAGASTTGLVPFASTFAIFAALRAGEGVRQSVSYACTNVKIVATNAGVEICGDGPSHQAVEDLAALRTFPNLTILSPSDNVTTRLAILAAAQTTGPFYVRLGRQVAEHVHGPDVRFQIGKLIPVRAGADLTLIAVGHMVKQAQLAADALCADGIEAAVLDCHTIKPLDRAGVLAAAAATGCIVTVEDHSTIGGLGGAVAEVLAEESSAVLRRVGLDDRYASSGRDWRKLMSHYGLDAAAVQAAAREALAAKEKRPR